MSCCCCCCYYCWNRCLFIWSNFDCCTVFFFSSFPSWLCKHLCISHYHRSHSKAASTWVSTAETVFMTTLLVTTHVCPVMVVVIITQRTWWCWWCHLWWCWWGWHWVNIESAVDAAVAAPVANLQCSTTTAEHHLITRPCCTPLVITTGHHRLSAKVAHTLGWNTVPFLCLKVILSKWLLSGDATQDFSAVFAADVAAVVNDGDESVHWKSSVSWPDIDSSRTLWRLSTDLIEKCYRALLEQ